jgi:uncharacterized membrane protein YfcA
VHGSVAPMLRPLVALLLCASLAAGQNMSWPLWPSPDCHNCSFFDAKQLGVGTVLVVAGAAICSGAGIGGGGVFVPTFILALGLNAHWALPLSQVTIFGVGIGSLVYLLPQRHPTLPRRLIDLNLAALLEPATLAGTIPGVYLNLIFPAYLITIFLAILLGLTTATTLRKGWQQRRAELAAAAAAGGAAHGSPNKQEAAPLLVNSEPEEEKKAALEDAGSVGSEAAHDGVWKWWQLGGLLACAAVLAASSVAKSFFSCYGPYYWLFVVSSLPVIGFFAVYFARQPPQRGQHSWVWSAAGFVAGLAAGFLGIGGGMVKSPLMIYMRTTPQVIGWFACFSSHSRLPGGDGDGVLYDSVHGGGDDAAVPAAGPAGVAVRSVVRGGRTDWLAVRAVCVGPPHSLFRKAVAGVLLCGCRHWRLHRRAGGHQRDRNHHRARLHGLLGALQPTLN